ncbi:hypothetical protein C1I92_32770 [Jiangella anatolica]|uniref:Uncharacterized protein n=1 Tax=Jiangella anatolica TaxID=2670374 RepID=A0A2W2CG41_9ACTN|nr:hypothetical protein C1I92_32770 [Jiangella anatolica]
MRTRHLRRGLGLPGDQRAHRRQREAEHAAQAAEVGDPHDETGGHQQPRRKSGMVATAGREPRDDGAEAEQQHHAGDGEAEAVVGVEHIRHSTMKKVGGAAGPRRI